MRRVVLIALTCTAACAHRAPEDAELWVPRGQGVPAVGELDGAEVWVPANASATRANSRQARLEASSAE